MRAWLLEAGDGEVSSWGAETRPKVAAQIIIFCFFAGPCSTVRLQNYSAILFYFCFPVWSLGILKFDWMFGRGAPEIWHRVETTWLILLLETNHTLLPILGPLRIEIG